MQLTSTYNGWSWNAWGSATMATATNNTGEDVYIKSITLVLGTVDGYCCEYSQRTSATGYGNPISATVKCGGKTATATITKVVGVSSWSGGSTSKKADCSPVTFTFSDKPFLSNGSSVTVTMTWGSGIVAYNYPSSSNKFEVESAYSEPGYSISSVTDIIRVGRDSATVTYSISGGTNNLSWVKAIVNGSGVSNKEYSCGTGKGSGLTKTFTPSTGDGYQHGKSYTVKIQFNDGEATYTTGTKTFYTYQEPTISGLSANRTEVNASNQTITFTMSGINNRAWTSYEDNFYTQAHCTYGSTDIGNGWTTVGTAGTSNTFSLSGSSLRGFVPKSYDGQTVTMNTRRVNSKADWYSSAATTTFKVYYRPRKTVTCANTSYKKNSSSGSGISKNDWVVNDSSLTGIYVSWIYDLTTADAGYTQGYRIRLYNSSGSVVKTYYTTNKYYTIPKADIPKMQFTYIDITPYYGNDQSSLANSSYASNYWYYNAGTIEKCQFVVMAAKLDKPEITYPVEGSNWINTKFRVCFQLPADPDKGSETETYHYEDIEIDVNGKIYSVMSGSSGRSSSGIQQQGIWSTTDLTYQKKMVVAPCLGSGFPSATTYKIKVRVKKKYTEDKVNWSDWSNVRTFTITTASFTPSRGDIIYATHYNNAKALINRVRNTYGVAWSSQPANVSKGTTILRSQYPYSNWYDRIVATKKQVNDYAVFDSSKTSVKFDSSNAIKENFSQYIEYVTAASNEDKSDASGRNYMRIVYDRCNRLI